MDKIDLRIIHKQAKEEYIADAKARAEEFVKTQAVPELIRKAKKMSYHANIIVPEGMFMDDVVNGIKEMVICNSIETKGRRISVWWI